MGWLGLGVTQGDQFDDIYREFMNEYDSGTEIEAITKKIIAEHSAQFAEDDVVMHETYFAVAKAQWRCGALSEEMLRKVQAIVESGGNVELMAELGLTPAERKIREKNLRNFIASLQTPPAKPHKRPPQKNLPDIRAGDCCCFAYKGHTEVFVVLDTVKCGDFCKVFCCDLQNTAIKKADDILNEKISGLKYINVNSFCAKEHTRLLGHIELPENLHERIFSLRDRAEEGIALHEVVYKDDAGITLGALLTEMRFDLVEPEEYKLCYEKMLRG